MNVSTHRRRRSSNHLWARQMLGGFYDTCFEIVFDFMGAENCRECRQMKEFNSIFKKKASRIKTHNVYVALIKDLPEILTFDSLAFLNVSQICAFYQLSKFFNLPAIELFWLGYCQIVCQDCINSDLSVFEAFFNVTILFDEYVAKTQDRFVTRKCIEAFENRHICIDLNERWMQTDDTAVAFEKIESVIYFHPELIDECVKYRCNNLEFLVNIAYIFERWDLFEAYCGNCNMVIDREALLIHFLTFGRFVPQFVNFCKTRSVMLSLDALDLFAQIEKPSSLFSGYLIPSSKRALERVLNVKVNMPAIVLNTFDPMFQYSHLQNPQLNNERFADRCELRKHLRYIKILQNWIKKKQWYFEDDDECDRSLILQFVSPKIADQINFTYDARYELGTRNPFWTHKMRMRHAVATRNAVAVRRELNQNMTGLSSFSYLDIIETEFSGTSLDWYLTQLERFVTRDVLILTYKHFYCSECKAALRRNNKSFMLLNHTQLNESAK